MAGAGKKESKGLSYVYFYFYRIITCIGHNIIGKLSRLFNIHSFKGFSVKLIVFAIIEFSGIFFISAYPAYKYLIHISNIQTYYYFYKVKKIHVTLIQAATPRQIARKYNVKLSEVSRRLQKGTKIEHEHTGNRQVAMKIAIDHLLEDLNYYNRVKL